MCNYWFNPYLNSLIMHFSISLPTCTCMAIPFLTSENSMVTCFLWWHAILKLCIAHLNCWSPIRINHQIVKYFTYLRYGWIILFLMVKSFLWSLSCFNMIEIMGSSYCPYFPTLRWSNWDDMGKLYTQSYFMLVLKWSLQFKIQY